MKLRYRDRDGEIFVLRHAPRHHWWYFPHMTKDQTILLKALEDEYQMNHTPPGPGVFDYQGIIDNRKCGRHTFRKRFSAKLMYPLPRKAISPVPKLARWAPFAFVIDSFLMRASDYRVGLRDR